MSKSKEKLIDKFDFEELKSRLNEISASLHQILDEQRRSNVAMENIGDEITFSNERIYCALSEVNVDGFDDNTVLFLGFRKKCKTVCLRICRQNK